MASEEAVKPVGKERVMADYYSCTDLEPLLHEIRRYFEEADGQQKPLALSISNTGQVHPYVLRTDDAVATAASPQSPAEGPSQSGDHGAGRPRQAV